MYLLNMHAPMKTKYIRANNGPFMNKILTKAPKTRSRLRNKYLKCPSNENETKYKKQRNYCTRLFKKEKKKFYDNVDISQITNNKTFWQAVKPLFSEKHFRKRKIILREGEEIVSNALDVAETINIFFSNIVENLGIIGYQQDQFIYDSDQNHISKIISNFEDHPSIIKLHEVLNINESFHFFPANEQEIS